MSPRLKPYDAEDADRTKPSVMLLDWIGEDEVTVRWETVRRERPWPVAEAEAAPERWHGIGPRGGGIALGVVLGVSLAIGSLAFLLPQQEAPASPRETSFLPVVPMAAPVAPVTFGSATLAVTPVVSGPTVTPVAGAVATAAPEHRVRTLLNLDSTLRAKVVLDGKPLGTTPLRVAVTPGEHVVVFVHPVRGRMTLHVDAAKDRVSFATAKY